MHAPDGSWQACRVTSVLASGIGAALAPLSAVRAAWVFGSQARGDARDGSDLDVAVDYAHELDLDAREQLRRDIVDALTDALGPLGERADVVDLRDCDPAVAFAAIREGELCLARDEDERCAIVSYVARRYEDDAPRRALFRSAARHHAERG